MKGDKSFENGQYSARGVALHVQPLVRQKAEHLGARGTEWLAQLPTLVSDLERQWSITAGEPLSGGSASYVCRAVTRDGADAVLKLSLPDDGFQDAARLLEAAQGNGYVRLLGIVDVGADPHAVVVDTRTQRVFIAHDRGVSVLDAHNGSLKYMVAISGGSLGEMAVDEQGGHVFAVARDSVYMLDAHTGAVLRTTQVGPYPTAIAVADRNRRVFVTGEKSIHMLDARTGAMIRTVHVSGLLPSGVAVDDQTARVFVTDVGAYDVRDARDGKLLRILPIGAYPATTPAVNINKGLVFVVSAGPSNRKGNRTGVGISIINATTGRNRGTPIVSRQVVGNPPWLSAGCGGLTRLAPPSAPVRATPRRSAARAAWTTR